MLGKILFLVFVFYVIDLVHVHFELVNFHFYIFLIFEILVLIQIILIKSI